MPNRPKPTALRLLEGSVSRYAVDNEPVPVPGLPVAPETMPPDVRAVWDYTVDQLADMNLATTADRDLIAAYCFSVVTAEKAALQVHRDGILLPGFGGELTVKHPALGIQKDSTLLLVRLAIEFGLTPAARTRINARAREVVEDDNPFAAEGNAASS